ncbi:hypothetical protein BDB01DRAFT_854415 [Pilobolus umbonatus]|nr:hypothetical protein BDB01DRAFT_854415 [Pilobolus umbonatus]
MSQIEVLEHCTRWGISLEDTSILLCEHDHISEWHRIRIMFLAAECPRCHALHWKTQKTMSTLASPRYESFCRQGKVVLLHLQHPLPGQFVYWTSKET